MDISRIAIKGSTQDHLLIADIRDDLVLLKDGSVSLVVQVSAVNFGLLSEQEQEAIIYAYGGLLNSLNFSIQIVVRSEQKDVSNYLDLLKREEEKQKNPLIVTQIAKYREFIASTVKNNNVLDKKFYIIIPYSFLELGVSSTAGGLFKKKAKGLPLPADEILDKAKTSLLPKRDHILRQLGRLGLRARQLSTFELVDLFYDLYNHKIAESNKEILLSKQGQKTTYEELGKSPFEDSVSKDTTNENVTTQTPPGDVIPEPKNVPTNDSKSVDQNLTSSSSTQIEVPKNTDTVESVVETSQTQVNNQTTNISNSNLSNQEAK